ncbi:MAG: Ig-like domain-containing protein [Candidatus Edwardsbacteria bacterium]|nr:Ig-like domain-containing protein [Candidatus Edwardsbacteria bacterium]
MAGATQYELQVGKGHRWVFAAYYYNGLNSYNLSRPSQPVYCGQVSAGNASDIAVIDSFALVASNHSLWSVNISDPAAPVYRGWTSIGSGDLTGIVIRDTLAYLSDWGYGLRIVNVKNPLAPVLVGSYDSPGSPRGLALSGNYVYLADANSGLQVIDVSDPANPASAGSLDTPGDAFAVAVAGNYAYVADATGGLRVINISDPVSPVEAGSYFTGANYTMGVTVNGSLAYLADGSYGLRIINISNPASPIQFGQHDSSGLASDYRRVVLDDTLAYVADWENGLWVINVKDPYQPRTVSRYNANNFVSLALLDSFAPVLIDSVAGASECEADTFLADGSYYWRARAGAGAWGDFSAPRRYVMDTQAPPACWINIPAYNQLINDPTPEFNITKQYNEYHFQLQISTDTGFAVMVADTVSLAEIFELQTPLPDGWLYGRVRGGDLAGNWAAWSSRLPFKLDSQAPGQLTAVTANGASPSPWTKNDLFSVNFTVPPDSSAINGYFYKLGAAPSSNFDTTGYGISFSKPFNISVGSDGVTPFYVWARDQAGNLDFQNAGSVNLRYDHIAPQGAAARSNEFSRTPGFTLSWNAGSDQGGSGLNGNYWIKYKINSGGWSDLDVNYAGTSYNFTGAQGNKYYFEVSAWDSAGNSEAFATAAECSTLVDNTITCPILVQPYNGEVRDSASNLFLWQRASAQAGSRLQCSYNSSFSALAKDTLLISDSAGTLALTDSLYYWRVRGENSASDTSGWSPARTLRIDTQAPEAPFLSEPGNDTLCNDNTPLFVWKESRGAVWYRLVVSPDSTFATITVDEAIDTTAYTIQVTLPDSIYYWRVMAGDAAGNWSAPSEKWKFTVDTKAPAVPALATPADAASLNTNMPQFVWRSSAQAVRYQLQLAKNTSFSPLETDSALADTSAVPAWGVNDGTHYWRVRCRDLAGNWSAYSNYRTVSISGILQVALITPDTHQVWPAGQSLWIQFTKPLYTGYIDTIHIKVRGKHTSIVRQTFTWLAASRTLRISPDSSFAANDTITVFLHGTLRDSANISTLDGNNSGTASGDSSDSYQMAFYTSYFGDYDGNRLVNAADLGMFASGWYAPYDRLYEAGPLSGSWPHQRVYVGGSAELDFEDLSGFIYSWNRADNSKPAGSGAYQDGPVSLEAAPGEKLKLVARISPEAVFASMDAVMEYDQSLLAVKALEASDLWQGGDRPQLFLSKQGEGRTVISAAKWQEGQEPSGQLFSMSFEGAKAVQAPVTLHYRLYDGQGAEICSGSTALTLNAGPGIPGGFFLGRAAPNPSNRPVAVSYQLPRQARVKLEVYNIAGQQVATLVDADQPAGYYSQTWDLKDRGGNRAANGIYFYQLSAGEFRSVGKMVVVR